MRVFVKSPKFFPSYVNMLIEWGRNFSELGSDTRCSNELIIEKPVTIVNEVGDLDSELPFLDTLVYLTLYGFEILAVEITHAISLACVFRTVVQ